jgi:hypothetical protein
MAYMGPIITRFLFSLVHTTTHIQVLVSFLSFKKTWPVLVGIFTPLLKTLLRGLCSLKLSAFLVCDPVFNLWVSYVNWKFGKCECHLIEFSNLECVYA